jgi:tetrahydromethanopterin S-methyltransferase subunit B
MEDPFFGQLDEGSYRRGVKNLAEMMEHKTTIVDSMPTRQGVYAFAS